MRTLSHHVFYKDARFYASFPSVVATDDSLLIVFRRGRDTRSLFGSSDDPEVAAIRERVDHLDARSQLVQLRVDAKLRRIEAPEPLEPDPEAADQDASLLRLQNGTLLLASFAWYPVAAALKRALLEQRIHFLGSARRTGALFVYWGSSVRRSHDQGRTWSAHAYLPEHTSKLQAESSTTRRPGSPVRGQFIETRDAILLPAYGGGDAVLYVSRDSGLTFAPQAILARHRAGVRYFEPALHQTQGGTLVAFLRTSGADDRLATSTSLDGGATWQAPQLHNVVGHPYHPLPLPDGRVLLTYGYRHAPYGIRARVLTNDCRDIDAAKELVIRDDGACGDVGYPWAALLPDGNVLVVYYFTAADGVRHIAGSVLRPT